MSAQKARQKSAVWEYYTSTAGKALCNTCKVAVRMGDSQPKITNTSNLWSHLRIHHLALYESAKKQEPASTAGNLATAVCQPAINNMFPQKRKWTNSDDRSKHMDK